MVSASSTEDGMAGHHPDLNKVRLEMDHMFPGGWKGQDDCAQVYGAIAQIRT